MAEDVVMEEPVEALAMRRSRRSTAGNRMEAALAEMALDTQAEPEDDRDFENVNDEQDEFGSDFESTDDEAAQEGTEEAEKAINDEEKRARKASRSKLEKVTAVAHARNQATFNPQIQAPDPTPAKEKISRRVSMGATVNAETGEVIYPPSSKQKRYSQRTSTVASTSASVARVKLSEEQKASAPKKGKTIVKRYTQAELIARALDNEEGNIIEHRDYLKIEEEKRKRARVTPATIDGPLVRWVSKLEEEKRAVTPPPAPPPPPPTVSYTPQRNYASPGYHSQYPYHYGYNTPGPSYATSYPYPYPATSGPTTPAYYTYPSANGTPRSPALPSGAQATTPVGKEAAAHVTPAPTPPAPKSSLSADSSEQQNTEVKPASGSVTETQSAPENEAKSPTAPAPMSVPKPTGTSSNPYMMFSFAAGPNTSYGSPTNPSLPNSPPGQNAAVPSYFPYHGYYAQPPSNYPASGTPYSIPPSQPTQAPEPEERIETVTKNYVVHEAGQYDGVPKPPWKDTMSAFFGNHVKWDELRVYATSKTRPTARLIRTCPITGKEAKYQDPRSGVPFADVEAFKVLSEVLKHEYVWDPVLKRYVGHEDSPS